MAEAALAAYEPMALILDLSGLHYEWGDDMDQVLSAGESTYVDGSFPMALVVGDKCREGLRTLCHGINSTERLESLGWAHSDLDAAWSYIDRVLEQNTK